MKISYVLCTSAHTLKQTCTLPNETPPIFYQHGLLFQGNLNPQEILKTYQRYSKDDKGPSGLVNVYNTALQSGLKKPSKQGLVAIFTYTNTLGYNNLFDVNLISKIEIDGKTHCIRDIYHLFALLNPKTDDQSHENDSPYIALYADEKDAVPFLVLPKLSSEQEKEHFEQYQINSCFSPEMFKSRHMPQSKYWGVVRERYQRGFFKAKTPLQIAKAITQKSVQDAVAEAITQRNRHG